MFFSEKVKKDATKYKNRVDVESIVRFDKALQKRVGSTLKSVLGAGSNGIAFVTNDDRVFKVTKDKDEALVSTSIIDESFKNVVKIYDVFKFVKLPIYGIVQEKLDKTLPDEYTSLVDDLYKFWDGTGYYKHKMLSMSTDEVLDEFLKKHKATLDDEESDIAKQILSGLLQLYKAGTFYRDLQIGNVGLLGGTVKIFDLGNSNPPVVNISSLEETFAITKSFKEWMAFNS